MNKIFLSASIPVKDRDPKYFDTADVIAIRDAVKALAAVVIPKARLVWGGHPAITPLIRGIMVRMHADLKEHITLYQSAYFEDRFPPDNFDFEDINITPRLASRDESLALMRRKMLEDNDFSAGIFIGGMEGVEEEFKMFREFHPDKPALAVASTGAAAKYVYEELEKEDAHPDKRLETNYTYMALFKDLLKGCI